MVKSTRHGLIDFVLINYLTSNKNGQDIELESFDVTILIDILTTYYVDKMKKKISYNNC